MCLRLRRAPVILIAVLGGRPHRPRAGAVATSRDSSRSGVGHHRRVCLAPGCRAGRGPAWERTRPCLSTSLIRDPRFTAVVNDIVVESGSARYQDVIDRFLRGEEVPGTSLRAARENTVTPTPAWDRAMRVTRMMVSGMPATVGERLARECAAAKPQ